MAGIMLAGRLTSRVDPRHVMFVGILMVAASLWQMTGWTPDIDVWSLSGHLDRPGFRPRPSLHAAQVVAFSTLPVEFRTDGTSLFSLLRNVGSAVR